MSWRDPNFSKASTLLKPPARTRKARDLQLKLLMMETLDLEFQTPLDQQSPSAASDRGPAPTFPHQEHLPKKATKKRAQTSTQRESAKKQRSPPAKSISNQSHQVHRTQRPRVLPAVGALIEQRTQSGQALTAPQRAQQSPPRHHPRNLWCLHSSA